MIGLWIEIWMHVRVPEGVVRSTLRMMGNSVAAVLRSSQTLGDNIFGQ